MTLNEFKALKRGDVLTTPQQIDGIDVVFLVSNDFNDDWICMTPVYTMHNGLLFETGMLVYHEKEEALEFSSSVRWDNQLNISLDLRRLKFVGSMKFSEISLTKEIELKIKLLDA